MNPLSVKRTASWAILLVALLFLLLSLWRIGAERGGERLPPASPSPARGELVQRPAVEAGPAERAAEERSLAQSESNEKEHAPSQVDATSSAGIPRAEPATADRGAAAAGSPAPWLVKISSHEGGFSGRLHEGDRFGAAITEIADLDADGQRELAVGAPGDDEAGDDAGAVWILFPERDGRVRAQRKLTPLAARLPARTTPATAFGHSLCFLETRELAVARTVVPEEKNGPAAEVWLLALDREGGVDSKRAVDTLDLLGETAPAEVTTLVVAAPSGAFAGDRNVLAVGLPAWPENWPGHGDGATESGWVTHFELRSDGRIVPTGGYPPMRSGTRDYGRAILLADVFGDGLQLENVAAYRVGEHGEVLRHSSSQPYSSDRTGALTFPSGEDPEDPGFGSSLAWLGDRDGDGSLELAVGLAEKPRGELPSPGGIWIVALDRKDLRVLRWRTFLPGDSGTIGRARAGGRFGASLATLGDRDGDSRVELAIGAPGDDDGEEDAGAIWLLRLGIGSAR